MIEQSFERSPAKPKPVRIIKRYSNRKLYDTQHSCYVTLYDISKMIRCNEEIIVIDNKSNTDITKNTLNQIIFDNERHAAAFAPVKTLREIIQNKNGTLSQYLAKLGAIPEDYFEKEAAALSQNPALTDYLKQSLGQRITAAKSFPEFNPSTEILVAAASLEFSKTATAITSQDESILLPGSSIV